MTGQQLTPFDRIKSTLVRKTSDLKSALPAHIPPAKFINTAMLAFSSDDYIQRACTTEEGRKSFFTSVMRCAQDGLLPDKREAAFAAYGNIVQYMPMVEGLQKTMRNSGEVESIAARIVYSNDHFVYHMGDEERIEHVPAPLNEEPGEPMGAYCVIRLKDGGVIREVMRQSEIKQIQAMSKAKGAGPWTQWPTEMWKKTVIRRAYKRAPKSADADHLVEVDNEHFNLDASATTTKTAASILNGMAKPSEQENENVIEGEAEEVPTATYAEILEALDEAPNKDALDAAASLIGEIITDENERVDLITHYERLSANIAGG